MKRFAFTLAAPAVAIATLFPSSAASASAVAPQSVEDTELITRINDLRSANGIAPLVVDDGLKSNAQDWAQSLADRNALFHQDLSLVMLNMGARGENVGRAGSVDEVFNRLANSSAHRANMLNGNYNRIGMGVKRASNGTFFTANEFGRS